MAAAGFLSHYMNGPLPYVLTPYNRIKNVLSVLLNKTFPSFHLCFRRSNNNSSDSGARIMFELTAGKASVMLFSDVAGVDVEMGVNDAVWHHVCLIYADESWKLFVDGFVLYSHNDTGSSQQLPER